MRDLEMQYEDSERNSSGPDSADEGADGIGATARRERRKRYPGILSKLASGLPEDAAVAVLKGELELHGVGSCRSDEEASDSDDATLAASPESGKD